jgi:molecular chaperone HscB
MTAPTTSSGPSIACWSCAAPTDGAHFCPACGKIQPLPSGADYFTCFGIPCKLVFDADDLEQKFHSLSWRLHPDNFMRASEFERQLSLDRSSQLNDAFRALRDPVGRVEYLLGIAGMRKEGQHKQQAPPELLEEVFELNEWLDELRSARESGGSEAEVANLQARLLAAQQKFESSLAGTDAELARVSAEWDGVLGLSNTAGTYDSSQRKIMERMNEILNRRSYIRNLVASTQKELTEA